MERRPTQFRVHRFFRHFCWGERGGLAVEFAILLPVFLLLVFGILDFGHAWYMDHIMSNASREGARYATRYQTNDAGKRMLPSSLSPSITNYVKNTWGLVNLLPSDANPTVTPTGPGYTETNNANLAGEDLTVTVTARKTWFVIGSLIPGLGSYKDLSVATTMKCE